MPVDDGTVNLDQRRFGRLVSRQAWLVLLCIILGAAVGAALTFTKDKTYTATTQLRVANPLTLPEITGGSSGNSNTTVVTLSDQVALLNSDTVKNQVESRVGASDFTTAFASGNTGQVVTINVTSKSADVASRAAETYTKLYLENLASRNAPLFAATISQLNSTLKSLDDQIAVLQEALKAATSTNVNVIEAQVKPQVDQLESRRSDVAKQLYAVQLAQAATPSGNATVLSPPTTSKNGHSITTIAVGAVVGLALGLLFAGFREARFGRVVDESDVERFGIPVLATVAAPIPRRVRSAVAALATGRDVPAYREAAVLLAPPHTTDIPRRWLIAGVDGDGTAGAVLTGRLARQIAQMGRRVALVECSAGVRRSGANASQPGLAEVLRGEVPLTQGLALDGSSNVAVMTAGNNLASLPEPLASRAFAGVLDGLGDRFDIVILTGNPLEQSADAYLLAPLVDLMVMALHSGVTRRDALRDASPRLAAIIGDTRLESVLMSRGKRRLMGRGPGAGEPVAEPVKRPAAEPARGLAPNPVPLHGSAS